MRTQAAVLYEMEKPAPYAESRPLVIEEVELSGPGRSEVLVEMSAAGLCHSDLSVINGSRPRVMPMVMGHEASGTVREVGKDVIDLKPGDQVVFSFVPTCSHCLPCNTGRPALCENGARANTAGSLLSGAYPFAATAGKQLNHHLGVSGFSHYTVAAQESLVRIDPPIDPKVAALFGCAVMTGVGAVVNTAGVHPGASIVIFGMGGVGLSSVLGAHVSGAYPIVAVDMIDDKLEAAKAAGASHVVNASNEDAVEAVREITRGGADYGFESVGSEKALLAAYQATGRGGTTVTMGLPHPSRELSLQAVSLVAEERTLKGAYMGSAVPRRDIPRFINLYRAGRLPVEQLLTRTIGLDEINQGFDALAQGKAIRQVVSFD